MRDAKNTGGKEVDKKDEGTNYATSLIVNNFKLFLTVGGIGTYLIYKAVKKAKSKVPAFDTMLAINNNVNVPFEEVKGHDLFNPLVASV